MEQLEFIPRDRVDVLYEEIQEVRTMCNKVRKGQYARLAELTKMYVELHYEFELLKKQLCEVEENA